MKAALAAALAVLALMPVATSAASAHPGEGSAFYSGVVTGPGFCLDLNLGGLVTYPFDSDGDGVADVCALPRTRRAAVARQLAMERLAVEFSVWFKSLLGEECAAVRESFGNPQAEAQDECQTYRARPPRDARVITAEAPLRVYVAGDSQAQFLGSWLNGESRLDVTVDTLHSTGLARPDLRDWPSHFADVLGDQDPELVVLAIGANDTQAMFAPDGTVVESYLGNGWHEEWSQRLSSVLDQFAAPHRHLVWVGQPPALPDDFRQGYAVLNRLAAEVIAARRDTSFVDIWELFGGDGPYQAEVVPPGGGEPVTARQSDVVHLSFAGARWVADLVVEIAQGRWEFEGSG